MNRHILDFELTQLYESNGLFARIIDTPASEAVRSSFLVRCQDRAATRRIEDNLERLDLEEILCQGITWARLFGGAIGIMDIADGRDIGEPVAQRAAEIEGIRIFDSSVAEPVYTDDPATPEYFHVSSKYSTFTAHRSRCLIFRNDPSPERGREWHDFWGIPEYARIAEAMQKADSTHHAAVLMLEKAVQPVWKMHGLSELLSTEDGERQLLRTMEALDMIRGLHNTIVIDSRDSYKYLSSNFASVTAAISACEGMICAASGIPYEILFGDYHTKNIFTDTPWVRQEVYYNMVEGIQERMIRPNLRKICKIIAPETVPEISFSSLWSESKLEKAEAQLSKAKAELIRAEEIVGYIEMGALYPAEVKRKAKQFLGSL